MSIKFFTIVKQNKKTLVLSGDFGGSGGVTQEELDQAVADLQQDIQDAVTGLLDDRGNYDASGNTFPASGGSGTAGAIKKGDMWTISVAGTLGGVAVEQGDWVRALVDTPGQTSGNWAISQNNIGYTPENSANKGQASGYASLNSSSKVVEDPANATATPTASKIPIADGSGLLDAWISNASTTLKGLVELAIASEVTTGTDATRAVTPDSLAGSDFGKRIVGIQVFDVGSNVATGDGKAFFRIPAELNGYNLVGVAATVYTAGTTNTTDIQIRNKTDAQDMLSTKMTIDSGETDTATAATAPVIDGTKDDVATGDVIAIDVDAVSTTAPKGLYVQLVFQLP